MLLLCVGPQALARLLFEHYGQYHIVAIAYTCVTQQVCFIQIYLLVGNPEEFHKKLSKISAVISIKQL